MVARGGRARVALSAARAWNPGVQINKNVFHSAVGRSVASAERFVEQIESCCSHACCWSAFGERIPRSPGEQPTCPELAEKSAFVFKPERHNTLSSPHSRPA